MIMAQIIIMEDSIPLNKIFDSVGPENFAAEVQRVSEEQAFNLILPWIKKENVDSLVRGRFFYECEIQPEVMVFWEIEETS